MSTEFITTTTRLTIINNTIRQKRVIEPPKNYWFHSFILLVLFIGFSVDDVLNDKPYKWVRVLILLVWISPHLVTIYRILFINSWKSNIKFSDIKEIKLLPDENELEEKVSMILKSGRKKIYVFRKSEEQAKKFTEMISSKY